MSDKEKILQKGFQITCDQCLIAFIVPTEWREQRIEDKQPFYCPNGHQIIYDRREAK